MILKGQLSSGLHGFPSVLGILCDDVGCYPCFLRPSISSTEAARCRRQRHALFCLSAAVVNLLWSQTSEDHGENMLPVSTSSVRSGELLALGLQPSLF